MGGFVVRLTERLNAESKIDWEREINTQDYLGGLRDCRTIYEQIHWLIIQPSTSTVIYFSSPNLLFGKPIQTP